MTHARARCWVHEDCLADLELSIACGPNPLDTQVLDADWAEAAYGDCYGGDGDGDGVGGEVGEGSGRGDGDGDGYGWGCGDGYGSDGWGSGGGAGSGGYADGDGGIVQK